MSWIIVVSCKLVDSRFLCMVADTVSCPSCILSSIATGSCHQLIHIHFMLQIDFVIITSTQLCYHVCFLLFLR
uniref:Uncharacterized protein n=1 Tax=Rhizophora mucronata TaxID=61149 RepID=A0A2P2PAX9_RHIMU